MIQLTANDETRSFPDSWEAAGVLGWPCLQDIARHPPGKGKLLALRRLSQLSKRQFAKLTEEQVVTIDTHTRWLTVATPIREPFRKVMKRWGRSYHWPDLDFIDGQALAFQYADEYFDDIMEGDQATAIDATHNLMATLARPMVGNKRKPITSREEIEARAKLFSNMPPEWSAQAIMYWAGVKTAIAETYGEYLFANDTTGSPSTAPTFGWATWFREVAAEGVFGDLEAVHLADFHDVCQHLTTREGRRRDERRAHEAAMAGSKNK